MSTPLPAKKIAKEVRDALRSERSSAYLNAIPHRIRICGVRVCGLDLYVRIGRGDKIVWHKPIPGESISVNAGYHDESTYNCIE